MRHPAILANASNQNMHKNGTSLAPTAPDVHEQRRIQANARGLLQVKIARHERQRITYSHSRAFAALKGHTQDSIRCLL
jgi:hypothetical protein